MKRTSNCGKTAVLLCGFLIFALFVFSVSDHWLFSEDCSVQRFCSSPDGVMVCGNADGREVYAVTHDIVPDKGWVMQFKVIIKPIKHLFTVKM